MPITTLHGITSWDEAINNHATTPNWNIKPNDTTTTSC